MSDKPYLPTIRRTQRPRRRAGRRQGKPSGVIGRVRQMIDAKIAFATEIKYVDATAYSLQTITTSMTSVNMTAVSAGTSVNGRVGEQILLDRLDYRLNFITGDSTNVIRFIVVYDKQTNGALFSQTDLLELAASPSSMLNWQNHMRFVILHDEFFSLDTYNPQIMKTGTIMIKKKTTYNGTGNSIANVSTGALVALWISDSGAVPQPTMTGDLRLWFTDV